MLRTNTLLGLLMYASYFLLFLHFAIQTYYLKPAAAATKKTKTVKSSTSRSRSPSAKRKAA